MCSGRPMLLTQHLCGPTWGMVACKPKRHAVLLCLDPIILKLVPKYKLNNKENCSHCFKVPTKQFMLYLAHALCSVPFLWLSRTVRKFSVTFTKYLRRACCFLTLFWGNFSYFITACLDWRETGWGCCHCQKWDKFSTPCSVPMCILRTRMLILPCHLTELYQEQVILLRSKKNLSHITLIYFLNYYFQK